MLHHKLASFLLALSTILIFSTESIAQSEKEIFWWADETFREFMQSEERTHFQVAGALVYGEYQDIITGADISGILASPPEIVWKKLLESLEEDNILVAYNIFDAFQVVVFDASQQVLKLPNQTISIPFPNSSSTEVIGSSHAFAYTKIGRILREWGGLNESSQAFNQAIELQPDLAFPYNGLGKVQILQNRLEDATKSFKIAINLKSDYADAYNNLGVVLQKQGQLQEAVDSYRTAISFASTEQTYQANLAEAERQLSLANQIEPKLDASVRRSVVIVKTNSLTKDNCGDGTGWIVSNKNNQAWIVTNRHVVEECNNIEVVLHDDRSKSLPAEVFKMDEEKDLAVLKVSNIPADIKPLSIASTPPNDSDTVFVIGHPYQGGGESWSTVQGKISAIILGNALLQLDITVDGGNSGSPVLNRNNQVIGLIFQLSNDKRLESFATGSFGFAYPVNVIQEKLNLWQVPYENK